ncbi:MAG TPA: hypothetical protein VFL79_21245 [Terriglobia bacterium]|nr:hypothetical protein [Terriglobia bacterium]
MTLLTILLVLVPIATPGQSLGEIARQYRKEHEAREKKGAVPAKVFTNDDIARTPPLTILKSSGQASSSPQTKPSQPPTAASSETPAGTPAPPPGNAKSSEHSKEYWRARFEAARIRLAHAIEEQKLAEDELRLLQIQQARELDPDRSRKLNSQVDAAIVEVEIKRAATEKARQAMEQLEQELKDNGAPQDWIQEDKTADQ